jgi:CubicO group peptidase (beta-lactamase class C family)
VVIAAAALLLLYFPDIAPERYTDLANFFRVEMKRQGYAGFSVAAVADGSVLYVDGFGVDGSGMAIGPDSRLFAPAAAKSVAALTALSLSREGRLSLYKKVSDYLTWFSLGKGTATVRDLINHSTGATETSFDDSHADAPSLEAAARSILASVPSEASGSRFHYIDTDYQVLALVIEKATGKSYASAVYDQVFKPLGMASSSTSSAGFLPRGSASFFALPLPRPAPRSVFGGASGQLVTTAADIGQYLAFLLGPEKFKNGPLAAKTVDLLFAPLSPDIPYGYGLYLAQKDGGRFAYHDGSLDGFSSRLALWPDKRAGIALVAAQGSMLQSLISMPALTEGARRIMADGSAPRPFPLGRLYILLAVVATVHVLALALQTGGALRWAKEARDRAEASGSSGTIIFAIVRCWVGIVLRAGVAVACPIAIGLALGKQVSWPGLFDLEPGLAAWCASALLFGFLRNSARLAWLRGASGFRRSR